MGILKHAVTFKQTEASGSCLTSILKDDGNTTQEALTKCKSPTGNLYPLQLQGINGLHIPVSCMVYAA